MRAVMAVVLATMLLTTAASAQEPVVVSHQVIGLKRIDFVFSTAMNTISVEHTINSAIYPSGLPGEAIKPWAIFLDADGVTMKVLLGEAMVAGGSYTLALDGVMSSSMVPVAEGYEYSFTANDIVPPALHSVAFVETDAIDLVFTEDMAEAEGEDPANYLLFETAVPANVIGFADARMRGMYDRVFLHLDSPLTPGTQYTIEVGGMGDPSGVSAARAHHACSAAKRQPRSPRRQGQRSHPPGRRAASPTIPRRPRRRRARCQDDRAGD